jgi:hypothetical protein
MNELKFKSLGGGMIEMILFNKSSPNQRLAVAYQISFKK